MFNNIIVRLIVYYVATMLIFMGLFRVFPEISGYVAAERARGAEQISMDLTAQSRSQEAESGTMINHLLNPAKTVPVILALIAAFLVALPMTWVYRWTRPRKRYSQAFAHTLLVVPIAIALVVFLVKGSLPLAFSLAGIVAAIRFRTALSEPMDAVYMFMVIGIGLAAGVQLLIVAFIASLLFNAIALGVWRTNFGAQPALLSGWKLLPPDEDGQLLGVSGVVQPDAAGEVVDEKRYNAQLRVHTTQVEAAQRSAIPILEDRAKSWKMAQVIQQEDGSSIVEFDVRLKKSADLAAFIKEIEQSETQHVAKVELMKRKKKKPDSE